VNKCTIFSAARAYRAVFDCSLRSLAMLPGLPPPSSLAQEERLRSLLLRAAAHDFRRSQLADMSLATIDFRPRRFEACEIGIAAW
jgi:hypothetical protein